VPCLASWALQLVSATATAAMKIAHEQAKTSGSMTSMQLTLPQVVAELEANGLHPYGMIALSQGYLLTSIILASTMVHLIDRRFERAATWMFIGAALSFVGMIHSFSVGGTAVMSALGFPTASVDGQRFSVVYTGVAFIMIFFHVRDGGDTGWLELRQRIQSAHMYRLVARWCGCVCGFGGATTDGGTPHVSSAPASPLTPGPSRVNSETRIAELLEKSSSAPGSPLMRVGSESFETFRPLSMTSMQVQMLKPPNSDLRDVATNEGPNHTEQSPLLRGRTEVGRGMGTR